MELIDSCHTLNEEQQKQYAARELKKMAIIFGSVSVGMILLLLLMKAPLFLFPIMVPVFVIIFGIVLVIRYFVVKQMAYGYQLSFDEDGIFATFDKEKVGSVVTGMSSLSEARHGSRMDQGIRWKNIDYISVGPKGMKIYSKTYDMMNGNGKIEIPDFLDEYQEIRKFFETNYQANIIK